MLPCGAELTITPQAASASSSACDASTSPGTSATGTTGSLPPANTATLQSLTVVRNGPQNSDSDLS
jgi:hypothetical protein